MERVVHKASSHDEAHRWDIEQQASMTVEERLRAARVLKGRAYPASALTSHPVIPRPAR